MSANNIIYIKKISDIWWTWEQSASVKPYGVKEILTAYGAWGTQNELEAYRFAFSINDNVEYGVNKI